MCSKAAIAFSGIRIVSYGKDTVSFLGLPLPFQGFSVPRSIVLCSQEYWCFQGCSRGYHWVHCDSVPFARTPRYRVHKVTVVFTMLSVCSRGHCGLHRDHCAHNDKVLFERMSMCFQGCHCIQTYIVFKRLFSCSQVFSACSYSKVMKC